MRELTKHEKYVLTNIMKELCECGMFKGLYDARNGNRDFMYGVGTVMENLAYMISEEKGEKFSELFTANMIACEELAEEMKHAPSYLATVGKEK